MDLGAIAGIIGAIVGLCGVAATVFAFWTKWGKLNQRADDQDAILAELRKDVDRAQETAAQVSTLGTAIEHLAEKVSSEMKHIADVFGVSLGAVKEQITDLKGEVQHIRANRAMGESTRARRTQ